MNRILKIIFFGLIVKPLVLLLIGLNIVNRKALPINGPAVLAANHNSHLDTLVLMSLFPLFIIHKVRPVAAADYFLKNRILAWFTLNIIGIIPIQRNECKNIEEIFTDCHQALDEQNILILFPEGSRGKPEKMGQIKKGLFYLVKDKTDICTIPVVMHGLGNILPRGEALFVPFNCDVVIGDQLQPVNTSHDFVQNLSVIYTDLFKQCLTRTSIEDFD